MLAVDFTHCCTVAMLYAILRYVLWYENFNMSDPEYKRCCNAVDMGCCKGHYSIATSDRADGGFVTRYQAPDNPADCTCCSWQGDFNLFVDDDGVSGYLIVRHSGYFCMEKLDPTFTRGTGEVRAVEQPCNRELVQ